MSDEAKKGIFSRIFGGGKQSCCCNVKIEEITEEQPEESKDDQPEVSEDKKPRGGSCCCGQ